MVQNGGEEKSGGGGAGGREAGAIRPVTFDRFCSPAIYCDDDGLRASGAVYSLFRPSLAEIRIFSRLTL